jgi:23S rRNA (guanine2445-N2)-methyltransferase / 23S rRNA (guanine2069-N7)-methyltransferase
MGSRTWDVQRDHAELLIALSRMLAPGGQIIFSCNLRGFVPDATTLGKAKVAIEDITARTIPPDFERNSKIHHCYRVAKV